MNTNKQKSKIPMPPAKLWEILNEPIGEPIAEEELKNYRMIGVVDGIVDVERLKQTPAIFIMVIVMVSEQHMKYL